MTIRIVLAAIAAVALSGTAMAQQAQQAQPKPTMEQLLERFKESPKEMEAVNTMKAYHALRNQGKYVESMKYVSTSFQHHMTPNRMSRNGKTAYENWMVAAMANEGKVAAPDATKRQYRGSEDLVTVFHPFGCDIYRIQVGLITDHWDCTPWEPFSNKGELAQLQDMAAK